MFFSSPTILTFGARVVKSFQCWSIIGQSGPISENACWSRTGQLVQFVEKPDCSIGNIRFFLLYFDDSD